MNRYLGKGHDEGGWSLRQPLYKLLCDTMYRQVGTFYGFGNHSLFEQLWDALRPGIQVPVEDRLLEEERRL